jgi:hypothetical protein
MLCFYKLPDNLNLVVEHFLDEVGIGTVRVEGRRVGFET